MTRPPSPDVRRRLIDWPCRHTGAAFLILILLAAVGAAFAVRIPVDHSAVPRHADLQLSAELPGIDAATIEAQVTVPLERALAGLAGLQRVASRSREGGADIALQFTSRADRDLASKDVGRRVARNGAYLPSGMEPPGVSARHASGPPAVVYVVAAEELSREMVRWTRNVLVDPLAEMPEAAAVTLQGLDEREILVQPEPHRLAGLGLTFDDLIMALRREDDAPRRKFARRAIVAPGSVESIAARAVRLPDGERIALAEVARVSAVRRPGAAPLRHGNAPALRLTVYPRSPADAPGIAEHAGAHLAWLQANDLVPDDVAIHVLYDQARETRAWLERVLRHAGITLAVILLVVLVLVGRRTGAVVMLAFVVWFPAAVALIAGLGFSLTPRAAAGLLLGCGPIAIMPVLAFPAALVFTAAATGLAVGAVQVSGLPASVFAAFAVTVLLGILIRWLVTPWLPHALMQAPGPLARFLPRRWRAIPAPLAASITAAAVATAVIVSAYTLPAARADGNRGDFALRVYGEDFRQVEAASGALLPALYAIPGLEDVASSPAVRETWRLRLDPERMKQHGLVLAEVGRAFAIAREGLIAGEVADAERRLPLRLRLAPRAAGESFERLLLRGERENRPALYLKDIGAAERVMEPHERLRVNGKPAVEITGRWRDARARAGLERLCRRTGVPADQEFECAIHDPAI